MARVSVVTLESTKEYDAEMVISDGSPEPPNTFHSLEELEAMLLEGLNSGPATPMVLGDWDDIRRKGRALALRNANLQSKA